MGLTRWEFSQTSSQRLPEFLTLQDCAGIHRPFLRACLTRFPVTVVIKGVVPIRKGMRVALTRSFHLRLAVIIDKFVFENAKEPELF